MDQKIFVLRMRLHGLNIWNQKPKSSKKPLKMELESQIHPLQVKVTLGTDANLLDLISPDNDSKGDNTQRQQSRAKKLPIRDNNNQEHDEAIGDEGIPFDNLIHATTIEGNLEETNATLNCEELKENGDLNSYSSATSEAVYETSCDEGWQEGNSKGRSGNGANRKVGRKQRPLL
ncbi:putative clustered mitochondria protein isoform X1 [Sesbania bispinosa]|nr:putative clustered mitochondria protein isoform X1 [Sesbania bispinosa]